MTKTPGSDDVDMIEFLGAAMRTCGGSSHICWNRSRGNHGLSGTHQHRRSRPRRSQPAEPLLVDYLGVPPSTISPTSINSPASAYYGAPPSATDRRATTLETPAGVVLAAAGTSGSASLTPRWPAVSTGRAGGKGVHHHFSIKISGDRTPDRTRRTVQLSCSSAYALSSARKPHVGGLTSSTSCPDTRPRSAICSPGDFCRNRQFAIRAAI